MNIKELDLSIEDLKQYLGYEVQGLSYFKSSLILNLWQDGASATVIISALLGAQGLFCLQDHKYGFPKSEKKPVYLFAKTHLIAARLVDIQKEDHLGRVARLSFSTLDNEDFEILASFIPSALNISLSKGKKNIHLNKPKKIPELKAFTSEQPARELFAIAHKCLSLVTTTYKDKTKTKKTELSLVEQLHKKNKALAKVKSDLEAKSDLGYLDFATLLLSNESEAKDKFPQFYDKKINKHKLADDYFKKHKNLQEKTLRSQQRVQVLEDEVLSLQKMSEKEWNALKDLKSKAVLKTKDKNLATRKFEITSDLYAYFGKSASDNLKLLRASSPWHYWIHIKDRPSSHMIIYCAKSRELHFSEIEKACVWFVSESKALSQTYKPGDHFEIIMTQCRYVKAVKGDKLGRVTYSKEKVYRFKL